MNGQALRKTRKSVEGKPPDKYVYPKLDALTPPKTVAHVLKMKLSELWFKSVEAEESGNTLLMADYRIVHAWASERFDEMVRSKVSPDKTAGTMRTMIGVIDKCLQRIEK